MSCRAATGLGTLVPYMPNEPVVTQYPFPSEDLEAALRRVAATHGVQDVYWDIWGREHRPGADIQQAVLRAVGVDVTSVETVDNSLREWLRRERLALLPSCVVSADSESWLPVATGLRAGDLLAADPAHAPPPGTRVRIREPWRDAAPEGAAP